MPLIAGCPVANRAWAIPRWTACLAAQTRRPDQLLFIHSGQIGDETWTVIEREAARHGFPVDIRHDIRPAHPRHDNERFRTLAHLRNRLLDNARDADSGLLLSIDTDIMLEDPRTIERLCELIDDGADVAQPVTFLHPLAPRHWSPAEEKCWAYNFGWFPDPAPVGPQARWTRPSPADLPWGSVIRIDIPMACWLGNRRVLDCRYEWHESGEDVGFGLALRRAGAECVIDSGLYAPHVWCDVDLNSEAWAA